jgi:hypothetical protein
MRVPVEEIVRVDPLNDEVVSSYKLVVGLESGSSYAVGSPQSLTRLVHHVEGKRSRRHTPVLISEFMSMDKSAIARDAVDLGALAPLNLSMNRLLTFLEMNPNSRAGYRFRVMRKINPELHVDFQHWLGRLQLASLVTSPRLILDARAHTRYWVGWSNEEYTLAGQQSWNPLEVCATLENGKQVRLTL